MTRKISRRTAVKSLGAAGMIGLAGCGGNGNEKGNGTNGDDGKESVKAAFVYLSEVGDRGWSWAHDQGRKKADKKYDWLKTKYTESVAPSDSKQVFQQYANEGYDIVFGTTFGYMDPMYTVAKNNSDTVFEHCSGYKTRSNMGRYFGRMDQARYLAGIAAGKMTDKDLLGYVAAFPTAEVVRGINAFTLGAYSVNQDVSTKVRWTNTWFDPPKEKQAANALIDAGVDVMEQHQDSTAAVKAAANADIWAVGYDAPMGQFAGDNYITSPIWHWEKFYEPTVKAVKDGSWESDFYWKGLNDGIVDLDEWGPQVPDDVKSKVSDVRSKIESGDKDPWADSKFDGKNDKFLFQKMNSFVDPVEGKVPSS